MAKTKEDPLFQIRPRRAQANAIMARTKKGEVCFITIIGSINEKMAARVKRKLAANLHAETLHVFISSRGGLMYSGAEIARAILEHPAPRKIAVAGKLVASAATFPFLAADIRYASAHTRFLIHPTEINVDDGSGRARWTASRHEHAAKALRGYDLEDVEFVVDRTGARRDLVAAQMLHERMICAWQALSLGVVHSIRGVVPLERKDWRKRVARALREKPNIACGVSNYKLRPQYIHAVELAGGK